MEFAQGLREAINFFLGVGRWERSGGVAHQLTRFFDAGDFY